LFRPGHTGCWQCLSHRLRANTPVASYLEGRNGQAAAVADDRICTPASLQIGIGLAANAVATWVVLGELPELEGKLQTFDIASWKAQTHSLARLPFCPACGKPNSSDSFRPPVFER